MIPHRKQWKSWALPSKLTAVGAGLGALGLLLSILFFLFSLSQDIHLSISSSEKIAELFFQKQQQANKYLSDQETKVKQQQSEIVQLKKELSEAVQAVSSSGSSRQDIDTALNMFELGQPEKAELILRKKIDQNIGVAADAYRHIGAIYFLNDTHKSIDAYRKSTELDPENARGWNQLGHLARRVGKLSEAELAYREILRIGDLQGSVQLLAVAVGNLGLIYQTRGDLDKAEEFHLKALAIEETTGRKEGIANNYVNLAAIYLTRGDLGKAEEFSLKSLEIQEALGRKEGMGIQYANLGLIYRTQGDLGKAEEAWIKSANLFKDIGAESMLLKVQSLLDILR